MNPRKINLHPKDKEKLIAYCALMGYELTEIREGIYKIQDTKTRKMAIVQKQQGRFFVVREEPFHMSDDFNDIEVKEVTEDISENVEIARSLLAIDKNPRNYSRGIKKFLKGMLEIKSLTFLNFNS